MVILCFVGLMNTTAQNHDKIQKILAKELQISKTGIELIACPVESPLKEKVNEVYRFLDNNNFEGYLVLANGMGRYDEFTFMLLVDSTLSTRTVRVINYVSEHGGEIGSKKWLEQFVGYKGGELKYGSDIQAISGATYSASSITYRIREIVELLKVSRIE